MPTHATLLQRQQTLAQAANVFQTVKARYAITKNAKYIESELESYRETLKELMQEHDVEPQNDGTIPNDAPQAFYDDANELLQTETECRVHTITEDTLEKEDDKDSDISVEMLMQIDWMIE